jgi:rubrerythrin
VLCGRCGYRVEGLDTSSRCPECGASMAKRPV